MSESTMPPEDQGGEAEDAQGETPAGPADAAPSGEGLTAEEDQPGATAGREWLAQLQSMIDNVATHAGPAMRQVAAKAAELAAVAGEKAGPIAHKAADVTEKAGVRVAERGREVAAGLRRDAEPDTEGTDAAGGHDEDAAAG